MATFKQAALTLAGHETLHDMSMRQFALLYHLKATKAPEQRSTGPVATMLGVAKPTITRASERLLELGYLSKKDGVDRRTVVMDVTDRGVALLAWLDGKMDTPAPT